MVEKERLLAFTGWLHFSIQTGETLCVIVFLVAPHTPRIAYCVNLSLTSFNAGLSGSVMNVAIRTNRHTD